MTTHFTTEPLQAGEVWWDSLIAYVTPLLDYPVRQAWRDTLQLCRERNDYWWTAVSAVTVFIVVSTWYVYRAAAPQRRHCKQRQ